MSIIWFMKKVKGVDNKSHRQ